MQPFPSPMSVVERVHREAERNALRVRNGIRLAARHQTSGSRTGSQGDRVAQGKK